MQKPAYYAEFPIRCLTCWSPISSKAERYIGLVEGGYSEAEALDIMGVTTDHCRGSFKGVTIRWFNSEVEAVVDGTVPVTGYIPSNKVSKVRSQSVASMSVRPISLASGDRAPLALRAMDYPPLQLGTGPQSREFVYPTELGKPTYNPDPSFPQEFVDVGGGRKVKAKSGQTFICR
jgi:DNA-directed RNA polymerase subunit N (RpoN/RPB10)